MLASRESPVTVRLVVIGDDSGAGHGAKGYNGWAAQLGKLLNQQYGLFAATS